MRRERDYNDGEILTTRVRYKYIHFSLIQNYYTITKFKQIW